MPAKKGRSSIAQTARRRLGFESLRPGQAEAVEAILAGRDTLVVQPTGSGKSAIYQIAGLLIEGATLVISPLIALQKDQADSIQQQNSAEAAVLNSTQRAAEIRDRIQRLQSGGIEYIFLAPEQLRKPETIERLRESNISLFVVDEAHCISQWGHHFRPDYLRLGGIVEALGHPRILALTATASERVRREIVERLNMRDPKIFVRGFDRPNLHLRVDHYGTAGEKHEALIHRVRWADKPGIVYVATRKAAQEIRRALAAEDIESLFYHGGLARKQRDQVHEKFMAGGADVIVATNAFGMGIDKPNIRFVYHHDAPESLDSYYQEIGRAGRDGQKAEATLFYRRQDIGAQTYKTGRGRIEQALLEALATKIATAPLNPETAARELRISPRKLAGALQALEDAGAIEVLSTGEARLVEGVDLGEAARNAAEAARLRQEASRDRLERMRAYADSAACRREILLRHLGDRFTGPCGFCDNCEAAAGVVQTESTEGTRREVA